MDVFDIVLSGDELDHADERRDANSRSDEEERERVAYERKVATRHADLAREREGGGGG